ncbi:MAG TPA: hypothetical protein VE133_07750, partial [Candidatus Sulfotelmatobacter sp.]|nr:hypothetical protein [Candidatus Sulfotelmatobacter sp.]
MIFQGLKPIFYNAFYGTPKARALIRTYVWIGSGVLFLAFTSSLTFAGTILNSQATVGDRQLTSSESGQASPQSAAAPTPQVLPVPSLLPPLLPGPVKGFTVKGEKRDNGYEVC